MKQFQQKLNVLHTRQPPNRRHVRLTDLYFDNI